MIRTTTAIALAIALLTAPAFGQLMLKNGTEIVMTGSAGSRIVFPDGTALSTASGQGADGATGPEGPTGPAGADGSDALVPDGHGGRNNTVTGNDAFVGGGRYNTANGSYATVTGGSFNSAELNQATVGGGYYNQVIGLFSTIAGGYDNTVGFPLAEIGKRGAAIGGGEDNEATGDWATISGGKSNSVSSSYAAVGGGLSNAVSGAFATVGGGKGNTASSSYATVGGGLSNAVSGTFATVGGGYENTASAFYATVPGGTGNVAGGNYSFAAGRNAKIADTDYGAFLFADSHSADFDSAAPNEFAVRARGGVRFVTQTSLSGVIEKVATIPPGETQFAVDSAKELKENYTDIDHVALLDALASIPIQRWNYKRDDEAIQHIGPYAGDFHAAFGLNGEPKNYLMPQDLDGVALAAIQGLNKKLEEKQAQIDQLQTRLAAIEQRLTEDAP